MFLCITGKLVTDVSRKPSDLTTSGTKYSTTHSYMLEEPRPQLHRAQAQYLARYYEFDVI